MKKFFLKVTRDNLPQVKDKYPFIYLEHGRLEIDDSSVKWIDADCNVVPLPVATINTILLGPGTTVTHAAIAALASANCTVCWTGSESLIFYAAGFEPTAASRNLKKQISLAFGRNSRAEVVREMFKSRFPGVDLSKMTIQEMMGIEGSRVKDLYKKKAEEYHINWDGRDYVPGHFMEGTVTNRILTHCNTALYGILCSVIHSLGFSPRIGFVHSGSPLPFVYDIADLYKAEVSIDLAFSLTVSLFGEYNSAAVAEAFIDRIIKKQIISRAVTDIKKLMKV